jgi:hypothetical protein
MSRLAGLAVPWTMRNPIIVRLFLVSFMSLAAACGKESTTALDAGIPATDGPPPPQGGVVVSDKGDGGMPGPALMVIGPDVLSNALSQINLHTAAHGLPVRQLTLDDVRTWFEASRYFLWSKAERKAFAQHLDADELAEGWTFTLENIVSLPDSPWRITLCAPPISMAGGYFMSCGTVVEGQTLDLWVSRARGVCQDPTHSLCDEPFLGPFASAAPVALSPSVEVRVEPIQVAGEPNVPELAVRDALAVSVKLAADSIPLLVDYFAVGYDRAVLEARMRSLLGADPSRWAQVQEFMVGWIRELANTFPQGDANDVCHGPARLFYSDVLYNGDYDRSTEAVAVLLTDHYCQVADDAPPRFGDYLYNPGAHSARYILKDPASGRDVIFSVQSGGLSAYRFYWADEDMSGKPFAHQPMPEYRSALVDTWRRCR